MSDPTELTLWLCFSFALGLFTITAWVRSLMGKGKQVPPIDTQAVATDPAASEVVEVLPFAEDPPYTPPALEPTSPQPPPLPGPAEKVQTWLYLPLDFIWMGFIFGIFALLAICSAKVSDSAGGAKLDASTILVSAGFQLFLAATTIGVVWARLRPSRWLGLRWKSWPTVFLIAPVSVGVMLLLTSLIQLAGYAAWMEKLGVQQTQDAVKLLQGSNDTVALALMAVTAVLVAPVCEELVFRGYLYPAAKRYAGRWVAGFCVALVFAAAHGSLAALPPLFIFGLVLVVIYEKTGSIWAPIATHMSFNALTVIAQIAIRYFHIPIETP